jgi:hypothetical protein
LILQKDAGNVGIATTTPGYNLTVVGTGYFSQPVIVGTPTQASHAATKNYVDSAVTTVSSTQYWALSGSNLYPNSTSYNVGIGTTGPQGELEVQAAGQESAIVIDADAAQQSALYLYNAGLSKTALYRPGSTDDMRIWGSVSGDIITFKNAAGGNVGIGTTTPVYTLDVVGTSRFTQPVIVGTPTQTNHAATKNYVDSAVSGGSGVWLLSGSDLYASSTSWQVGIGTSTPTHALSVITTTNDDGILLQGAGAGGASPVFKINNSAGTTYARIGIAGGTDSLIAGSAAYDLDIRSAQKILFSADNGITAHMTILNDGSVGIGTTSPGAKLDVAGTVRAQRLDLSPSGSMDNTWTAGGAGAWRLILPSATNPEGFGAGAGGFGIYNNTDLIYHLIFSNNGTQTFGGSTYFPGSGIWNSSGNVGIGTTGPGSKLDIVGTDSAQGDSGAMLQVRGTGVKLQLGAYETGGYTWIQSMKSGVGYNTLALNPTGGNVGIGTTTPSQILSVVGTSTFIGNVGIGISTPVSLGANRRTVDIRGTGSGAGFNLGNQSTITARILTDGTDLYLEGNQDVAIRPNINTNNGMLYVTPTYVTVYNSSGSPGAGKLDVGTVDPPYTIGGKHYATYLPGMTGVKEETAGVLKLKIENSKLKIAEAILDLKNAEEGSDLWFFGKTTNLSAESLDNVIVLLTPNFDGKVWYEKKDGKIVIYATPSAEALQLTVVPLEVSYRLTAPRFDHEGSQFVNVGVPTYGNRQSGPDISEGLNLDKLLKQ